MYYKKDCHRVLELNCLLCLKYIFSAPLFYRRWGVGLEIWRTVSKNQRHPLERSLSYQVTVFMSSQTQGPMKSRGWTPSKRKKPMVTTPIWRKNNLKPLSTSDTQLACVLTSTPLPVTTEFGQHQYMNKMCRKATITLASFLCEVLSDEIESLT